MTSGKSYAISWREDEGATLVGCLELGARHFRVHGRSAAGAESLRTVRYTDVSDIASERPAGRRVLVLSLLPRGRAVIASLDRPGSLAELADELRSRAGKPQSGSGGAPMSAVA